MKSFEFVFMYTFEKCLCSLILFSLSYTDWHYTTDLVQLLPTNHLIINPEHATPPKPTLPLNTILVHFHPPPNSQPLFLTVISMLDLPFVSRTSKWTISKSFTSQSLHVILVSLNLTTLHDNHSLPHLLQRLPVLFLFSPLHALSVFIPPLLHLPHSLICSSSSFSACSYSHFSLLKFLPVISYSSSSSLSSCYFLSSSYSSCYYNFLFVIIIFFFFVLVWLSSATF
jgi:hypothetical protein